MATRARCPGWLGVWCLIWLGKLLLKVSDLIGGETIEAPRLKTDVAKSERLARLAVSKYEIVRKHDLHTANLDADDVRVCERLMPTLVPTKRSPSKTIGAAELPAAPC